MIDWAAIGVIFAGLGVFFGTFLLPIQRGVRDRHARNVAELEAIRKAMTEGFDNLRVQVAQAQERVARMEGYREGFVEGLGGHDIPPAQPRRRA